VSSDLALACPSLVAVAYFPSSSLPRLPRLPYSRSTNHYQGQSMGTCALSLLSLPSPTYLLSSPNLTGRRHPAAPKASYSYQAGGIAFYSDNADEQRTRLHRRLMVGAVVLGVLYYIVGVPRG
jgi:hypothetical protein